MTRWLALNWPAALGWALFLLSDALPYLPSRAKGVAQLLINLGRMALGSKALVGPPAPPALSSVPKDGGK